MVTRKKILITAGPTWVAIDQVRVISNLASGQTGLILADNFKKLGAKVTLALGPGNFCQKPSGIKLLRFNYFAELEKILTQELKKKEYAAVIHAAAVADYRPKMPISGKVSSKLKSWRINLVPTKKLISGFKKYQPGLFTVGFKFQPQTGKNKLIAKGRELLKKANLDLVIANSNKNQGYQAYIMDKTNISGPWKSKAKMASYLCKLMDKQL